MNRIDSHDSGTHGRICRRLTTVPRAAALVIIALLLAGPARGQTVIYVDTDAVGANDGTSWADAFVFLQDALAIAQDGDEVWVAEGVYRPDQGVGITPGDREVSFDIPSGASLYGGFSGTESARSARDWVQYPVTLSGDLLQNDAGVLRPDNPLRSDNTLVVVKVTAPIGEVRIDGIAITGATNDGTFPNSWGSAIRFEPSGGLPASLTVANSVISGNVSGRGAISVRGDLTVDVEHDLILAHSRVEHNWAARAAGLYATFTRVLIIDSEFVGNEADLISGIDFWGFGEIDIVRSVFENNVTVGGGVIHAYGDDSGSLRIWSSEFRRNRSTEFGAGAIWLNGSHLVSVNNVFSANSTAEAGGALDLANYTAFLVNNVFAGNRAGERGGAVQSLDKQSTLVANSIFWNNQAPEDPAIYISGQDTLRVFNSILFGGSAPNGIHEGEFIETDPLFGDPEGPDGILGTADDDFSLLSTSPAIDAGSNELVPADALDLDRDGDTNEPTPGDLVGNVRIHDGGTGAQVVDIGAVEFDSPPMGTAIVAFPTLSNGDRSRFEVYPNPASDRLIVDWKGDRQRVYLSLVDVLGRERIRIDSGRLSAGSSLNLDVSSLPAGLYFLVEAETRSMASFIIRR